MVQIFVISTQFPGFLFEISRPHGFGVVPRNYDEMQKTAILYWKIIFLPGLPSLWIQTYRVSRVLLITFFDVAE